MIRLADNWKRFRNWNANFSVMLHGSCYEPRVDAAVMEHNPFCWLWLMVPIAGIVFFDGCFRQWSMHFRWQDLEQRKAHRASLIR
jgi:hypothetical protein